MTYKFSVRCVADLSDPEYRITLVDRAGDMRNTRIVYAQGYHCARTYAHVRDNFPPKMFKVHNGFLLAWITTQAWANPVAFYAGFVAYLMATNTDDHFEATMIDLATISESIFLRFEPLMIVKESVNG